MDYRIRFVPKTVKLARPLHPEPSKKNPSKRFAMESNPGYGYGDARWTNGS